MNQLIVSAIKNKLVLSFTYHGYRRVVEPHTYGRDDKQVEKLSAWQISGKPADQPDWRLFEISDMQMLQTVDKHFSSTQREYKRNDSRMQTIYAQL